MNKEEFILKASDLLKWEESLKEREDEISRFEEKNINEPCVESKKHTLKQDLI